MALKGNYRAGSGDFEMVTEGVHIGVVYSVVDLGHQEIDFQGTLKSKHQLRITWELPSERMSDGRPFVTGKTYSASLHEKANLRHDYEAMSGKPMTDTDIDNFDPSSLIGLGCQIQIVHVERNGKNYANINSIMALPKGMKAPKPENPTLVYNIEEDLPDAMPEWLCKIILKSKEKTGTGELEAF